MDVIDRDFDPDEVVDVFLVPLFPPDIMAGANTTTPQQYSGRFGFATIELSFQLECQPGFFGEECVICDPSPCDNGGVCSPDATTGFTCTCVGDFTGRSCDMTIDDCLNVNSITAHVWMELARSPVSVRLATWDSSVRRR